MAFDYSPNTTIFNLLLNNKAGLVGFNLGLMMLISNFFFSTNYFKVPTLKPVKSALLLNNGLKNDRGGGVIMSHLDDDIFFMFVMVKL